MHATYYLQAVWSKLYKCTSSQDAGTLFQLRNLINQRSVVKEVRNDMSATEDYFKTVLVGHILTAAMQFFGMENEMSTPQHPYFTEDLASQPDSRKWEVLSSVVAMMASEMQRVFALLWTWNGWDAPNVTVDTSGWRDPVEMADLLSKLNGVDAERYGAAVDDVLTQAGLPLADDGGSVAGQGEGEDE